MASLSGNYGSRKGMSRSLPYLAAKSAIPIAEFLTRRSGDCQGSGIKSQVPGHSPNGLGSRSSNEVPRGISSEGTFQEGILVTGILFCGLWEEGNEDKVDPKYHNMIFSASKDDPRGCLKTYLEENDIAGERMGELIESSFKKGYLQNEPPFFGRLGVIPITESEESDYSNINDMKILEQQLLYSPLQKIEHPTTSTSDKDLISALGELWTIMRDGYNEFNEIREWNQTKFPQYEALYDSGIFRYGNTHQTWLNLILNILTPLITLFEDPQKYGNNEYILKSYLKRICSLDKWYPKWIQKGVFRRSLSDDGKIVAVIEIIDE